MTPLNLFLFLLAIDGALLIGGFCFLLLRWVNDAFYGKRPE